MTTMKTAVVREFGADLEVCEVQKSDLLDGMIVTRIGMPWLFTACGHCKHCVGGWETRCTDQQNTGCTVNGGFVDYAMVGSNYAGVFPRGLDVAPTLCAGVTVCKAIIETDINPSDTVTISGIGGLGHVDVQYAKEMGSHVVAVDISDDRLERVKSLGADVVINARTTDPVVELTVADSAQCVFGN